MAEEKEQELNEAELSDVKNSIAALAKKYITGSFFDKLADSSGIKIAKDILLDDLKNMIGHGTSGLAAKKFSNAIQMAKNPVAVDTILANYMLKGDGMGAGIGYSESEEIKPFKKFLSEAREEKKEVSQELIDEARKIVEAEGFTVTDPEADKHVISKEKIEAAKKIVEARGYKVVNESLNKFRKVTFETTYDEPVWDDDDDDDHTFDDDDDTNYKSVPIEMTVFARLNSNGDVEIDIEKYRRREDGSGSERLDGGFIDTDDKGSILEMLRNGEYDDEVREALLANESKSNKGFRVVKESEKKINEDFKLDMTLEIPAEEAGCDEEGLKDLIDDALAIGGMVDGIDDIEAKNGIVYVHFVSEEATPSSILNDLWNTVEDYIKTATGAEVEYGEDVVDFWERAFEKAEALL